LPPSWLLPLTIIFDVDGAPKAPHDLPELPGSSRTSRRHHPRRSPTTLAWYLVFVLRMSFASDTPGGALIRVKAVPGAKRDEVVGRLGDRLKVRVTQHPEGGKANRAICAMLAAELGIKPRDVTVAAGESSPEKTIRAAGVTAAAVEARWLE